MTPKEAQQKIKPFVKECVKDSDGYFVYHCDKKASIHSSMSQGDAIEILVVVISNHPEAFNYIIDEMNKKKIIPSA